MGKVKAQNITGKDFLWLFLFLIVFINGFEAGGYQASLYTIGQIYDLSITKMGIFASVELFATMLAPLVLGSLADRVNKIKFILVLLGIQTLFSASIFLSNAEMFFVVGIFFLGQTKDWFYDLYVCLWRSGFPPLCKLLSKPGNQLENPVYLSYHRFHHSNLRYHSHQKSMSGSHR